MAAQTNRTDLVADTSRLPGQPSAGTHGEVARKAEQAAALPGPRPPHRANITGPSQRPNEPVQAGLPIGPGPGPSGPAAMLSPDERSLIRLKAAANRRQSPSLMRLINRLESARR